MVCPRYLNLTTRLAIAAPNQIHHDVNEFYVCAGHHYAARSLSTLESLLAAENEIEIGTAERYPYAIPLRLLLGVLDLSGDDDDAHQIAYHGDMVSVNRRLDSRRESDQTALRHR